MKTTHEIIKALRDCMVVVNKHEEACVRQAIAIVRASRNDGGDAGRRSFEYVYDPKVFGGCKRIKRKAKK